ncbi:hypothetical protein B0J18DRAFT_439617 [Chaetomium sp. MPI-SDFR-AT-0129]|nr:hypothetical protein B0J18DRAFT_439617 [Chaetomium sp. MPI-SDFR-AT-0129]
MGKNTFFASLPPLPRPSPRHSTYWDSVIAEANASDVASRACFVAAGFDMWVVWSQIISELRRKENASNASFAKTYLPDYDRHGVPSLDMEPTYVSTISSTAKDRFAETYNARPAISSVMWQPRADEPQPNPWFDVLNFVLTPHTPGGRPFPFTHLPLELGQRIASLLPKESAAALSVTSRAMYNLVPKQLFADLTVSERWTLILLLERDSEVLVACQLCLKLHGPFKCRGAPCQNRWQFLLPDGITPGLCRLLAKYYIRQKNYADLLCLAGRTKIFTIPNFKIFSRSTLRMIDGRLFVRLESHIAPLTIQGDLTSRSAYLLDHILNSSNPQVCPHVRWRHLGVDLSYSPNPDTDCYSSLSALYFRSQLFNKSYLRDQLYGKDALKDQLFDLDHRRRDLFTSGNGHTVCDEASFCHSKDPWPNRHTQHCYDSKPVPRAVLDTTLSPSLICALFHRQPCEKLQCISLPGRFRVNQVRACELCATDMCVGAQDVGGIGRVISVTTWKSLGGIYDGQWVGWYPHSINVGKFARDIIVSSQLERTTRDFSEGTIVYASFESPPTIERTAWYTAPINGRIIAALTRESGVQDSQWIEASPVLHLNGF